MNSSFLDFIFKSLDFVDNDLFFVLPNSSDDDDYTIVFYSIIPQRFLLSLSFLSDNGFSFYVCTRLYDNLERPAVRIYVECKA